MRTNRRIDVLILPGLFLLAGYLFYYFKNHKENTVSDKTTVYVQLDSTCGGSTLSIDGRPVRYFDDIASTELFNTSVSKADRHEVRLSKPGKEDIVRQFQYQPGGGEEYLKFAYEPEHPFTKVVMQFDTSCAGGVLYIDTRKADSLQEGLGFEEKNYFLTQGDQHTVKMSKPGFSDVVYTVRYGSEQADDYLSFSFATP